MGCSKVCVGLVGAVVVITLIAVPTAVYVNRGDSGSRRTFTLDDFYNQTIRYQIYSLRWISDNEYLHKSKDGSIYLHNVETMESSLYLSNSTFSQVDATEYLVSADKKFICFESNYTKQWRHSFNATYSIYDIETQTFITPVHIPTATQLLLWAPVGSMLAYVWDYNIYIKLNSTAEPIQVTKDGKVNQILNGVPDWVYEEEVFASNEGIWWSPSAKYLAYVQVNDTGVHAIEYTMYENGQYPSTMTVPYPKAGTTIPTARLFVIDISSPVTHSEVVVPDSIGIGDHYLSSVTWVTDTRMAVQWITRRQDHVVLQVYDYDGSSWKESVVFEVKSRTGWVGRYIPLPPYFAADNTSFYIVMSDAEGYKHIHYVKGGKAVPITSGKWEVIYISKLTKNAIYYVSNEHKGRPGQRNLYKIALSSSGHTAPECLTCSLYEERCQFNSAYFSQNASYFRMDCYGPGLPMFTLMDNRGSCKEIKVLEDNKVLEQILRTELQMPTIKRAALKLEGFDFWYQMMFPPNFDASKKYPLLIQVYAGPASQYVDYRFRLEWATYLCSTEKAIVASFDGRGSGYQGDKIMHAIYERLGTYEVEDQISAVRKFTEMGFIDKDRIGIWGWSYGGYVTSMALGSGSGLFKCGIAVAPVSQWEYYDAVYTERYMHRPEENPDSYKNSTVTGRAKNFRSVQYLLVHGTADENVHFQQAAQISKALVEEQVDFEAMWYTDKDHGLSGKARYHLYTHLSHFLQKCFSEKK
ncbi:dipeptidyl peptidase 4 [Electrophorus electricus]|uniref:dipeptidyl peptidase 4 n=1 Tax=Electrophorus electricus TaxID=8005 RepID=UPI0015CFA296|nr:dipeptidyl peptidase 4 [Electrophorus electricus]